ncbi:phosphate regulon transcriptional regulator PhoB [Psychrosphaera ytuae]|uniref:Phosphate regulon transcriptional regulatory protein PhoB n=1 Tax=Psychrosphaera ytuae TaxID=2820710 RepID=A0A975DCY5_9GAMM|nr:phosphate regulon transcriptional regulator PhoB [Psychrosphaera ytuae]QTH64434.1 phosphate regulon transcriptional regulator PhoB [Psychrosphaera ytuae]
MSHKILIIEDEFAIREMLTFVIEQNGYKAISAENYNDAQQLLMDETPALILLDWMLPGMSGIQVAKKIKQSDSYKHIPIIMLTARSEEDDKIQGLEVGADDYITKPFSPKELIARIKAVLRRTQPTATDDPIEIVGLRLDPTSHRVTLEGSDLHLGPMEFKLLHFFMTHQERVYSRDQLLDNVWGTNTYVEDRTVDVHIRRLRKALITHDKLIQTVRGSGYRFSTRMD